MPEKKPRRIRDWYDEPEEKIQLKFVADPDAPEELHGQKLVVGEVRLLPRRYALYRWWKKVEEE